MSLRRTLLAVLVLVGAGLALAGASCETTGGPTPGWPPPQHTPGR